MSVFNRPPDLTLLSIILLLCTMVAVGFFVYKRFHGLKYCVNWLFRTTTTPQASTSDHILPSFGALSPPPPPYISPGRGISASSLFGAMRAVGIDDISMEEMKLAPETPSPSKLHHSPEASSTLSPSSHFGDVSVYSSSRPSSPAASVIVSENDRLPPNITMPIARQTALDYMMERWLNEAEMSGMRGGKRPNDNARYFPYTPATRISKDSSRPPNIIVTQPSSNSFSAYRSSYAFILSTGPDKDPFFWDNIPSPRSNIPTSLPAHAAPRRSKDANKENSTTTSSPASTGIKLPRSAHLSVPSRSKKHRTKSRRTVLGNSTNSRAKDKLLDAAYTGLTA